ncbi:MAG: efflux RND transporter permease subunit [Acidobacteria bacterium]|nr:efflux RND transporter permease subunit [Acidobacteriota bacterium]
MKRIIKWMVDNPVSANLLMAFLIGYGLMQMLSIKKEVFPEYSLDMISISVPYRGATPSDVEEAVCSRIEEEISGLDGIKRITSTSTEGLGTVMVEVQNGYNTTKLRDDIKSAVDRITNFPKNIEKPVVAEVSRKTEVLKVVLHGKLSEKDLKRYGERIRDDLSALRGISLVTLDAVRPYEISIEVSEKMLEKYHLTIPRIASIVQKNCQDIPAGKIRQKGEEILIRTKGLKYTRRDYMDIPVVRDRDGGFVRLRDIATIVNGFEETDSSTDYDGDRAVIVKVFRIGNQSALTVEKAVKNYLKQEKEFLPAGLHADIVSNMARILRERLDLLITNGLQGFILVIIMLAMFLELRLALWVAFGIPVSFFGAFILMPFFGVSVNMISLFALIICLGMVVDDAIIIGEHIFSKIQTGMPRKQAAVEGAREMAVPVIFSVLTTIAAFLPLLHVSGVFGKFMFAIPVVVISVLSISLLEAIFILPSHLAHLKERKNSRILRALPHYFNGKMTAFINKIYEPTVRTAIRHRGITFAAGILMLLTTIGYIGSGRMKFIFFPKVDSDQVIAQVQLPEGASAEQTAVVLKHLEKTAMEVEHRINKKYGRKIVKHIVLNVASQPYSTRHNNMPVFAPNVGEVVMELVYGEERAGIDSNNIAILWRNITGEIPGVESVKFTASLFSAGAPIDIQLGADNFQQLKQAAKRLEKELAKYGGVKDISDNIQGGKQEIKLKLNHEGKALGLDVVDLGLQVRGAFYGTEAVRIQREKDDVRVMVRYPLNERRSFADLSKMKIVTPAGARIPLPEVASWTIRPGYSVIKRADRRRVVNVQADVEEQVVAADKVLQEIQTDYLPKLKADYPGLTYSIEGQEKERRDSMGNMLMGFFVALFLIFVLLAIPFNSYIHPLIIMTAIPFGIIGAVLGHLMLGYDLSLMSFFGIVALSGVLVNDSLVLLDAIRNKMKLHPDDIIKAVVEACKSRFRPVILTSITTFGGLMPIIFEKSLQARFLIPMAISLGFGVMFATGITLILIPSLYMLTLHNEHV